MTRYASLSLDLDNQWSYMKTHGDAGWQSHPSYLDAVVPRILAFLAERRLTITFFIVGQDAALEKNRAALRSISAAGHEIGNHSFRHEPWLHLYTAAELDEELQPGRRGDRGRDRRAPARLPRAGLQPVGGYARDAAPPRLRLRRHRVPEPAEPAGPRLPLLDQQAHGRGERAAQRLVRHLEGRAAPGAAVPVETPGRAAARDSGHDAAGAQGADAPVLPHLPGKILAHRGAQLPAPRARRLPDDRHESVAAAAPARFHGPRGLPGARLLPRHGPRARSTSSRSSRTSSRS